MKSTDSNASDASTAHSESDGSVVESDSGRTLQLPSELTIRHKQVGRTWAWQLLAVVGWTGVLVLFVLLKYHWFIAADFYDDTNGIHQVTFSGSGSSRDRIAIIKITGVIYDGRGYVKSQIERIRNDKRIKAVVLRVNSPGGTVSGSDYIYHHLKKMLEERDIPVVVSMGSIAASGGYYVSMVVGDQPDSIFAEPTCTTGSIGVIIPHMNYSQLMETYGVVDDSIMSHPRKRMLTPSRIMPDDHRKLLQDYVNESFEHFKKKILAGRPGFRKLNTGIDWESDEFGSDKIEISQDGRDLATGEIFHAPMALRFGLVDRLGFIEDAIERAAELAELDLDKTHVVEYSRPAPWLEIPFLSKADASNQLLQVMMELNTPRAYYLTSNFPNLLSSWNDPLKTRAE